MRIELGELSTRGLNLNLPAARAGAPERTLRVLEADGLHGRYDGGKLTDAGCTRLAIETLHWAFGTVLLDAARGALFGPLEASGQFSAESPSLVLNCAELHAPELALTEGALRLRGALEARGLVVTTGEGVGRLTCREAIFRGFELQSNALRLSLPELRVTELVADWSGEFVLQAGTAEAPQLSLAQEGATATLHDVAVAALVSAGSRLSLGQLRCGRGELEADLLALRGTAAETPASARGAQSELEAHGNESSLLSRLDARLLDGLAGRVHADLHVDLNVPILGRRRAKHELRLGVEGGAIDYRALESGLATLEDSLLDFSVRDGALVLERGLPLLRTRGRGKPILLWPLEADDLELARNRRVRLARLPHFEKADARDEPEQEPSGDDDASAFKLRELTVADIDVALALMQNPSRSTGVLPELTFSNLTVRGQVEHQPEGPSPLGRVQLGLASLRAQIDELPIGARKLRGRLELATLRDGELTFEDLRPRRVVTTLEGLAIAELDLA
jgi:hypothetical protein